MANLDPSLNPNFEVGDIVRCIYKDWKDPKTGPVYDREYVIKLIGESFQRIWVGVGCPELEFSTILHGNEDQYEAIKYGKIKHWASWCFVLVRKPYIFWRGMKIDTETGEIVAMIDNNVLVIKESELK